LIHILVEGRQDKAVIEVLLEDLKPTAGFLVEAAWGKDAARPIARKYLVVQREPVAFVFDTDVVDRSLVDEQVRMLDHYFRWQSPGVPFELIPMVPAFEVLFFDHPAVLERYVGHPIDATTQVKGHYEPKGALHEVLQRPGLSFDQFVGSLSDREKETLRADRRISHLRGFVKAPGPAQQVGSSRQTAATCPW
jgi:hypothetical protein